MPLSVFFSTFCVDSDFSTPQKSLRDENDCLSDSH